MLSLAPPSGWTGTTPDGSTRPSDMSRRTSTRPPTTPLWPKQVLRTEILGASHDQALLLDSQGYSPLWLDTTKEASTKPGAFYAFAFGVGDAGVDELLDVGPPLVDGGGQPFDLGGVGVGAP